MKRIEYLPSESNLCGHDALPFDDQQAVGALALLPAAQFLVTFEATDDAVIAASGALRSAKQTFRATLAGVGVGVCVGDSDGSLVAQQPVHFIGAVHF